RVVERFLDGGGGRESGLAGFHRTPWHTLVPSVSRAERAGHRAAQRGRSRQENGQCGGRGAVSKRIARRNDSSTRAGSMSFKQLVCPSGQVRSKQGLQSRWSHSMRARGERGGVWRGSEEPKTATWGRP